MNAIAPLLPHRRVLGIRIDAVGCAEASRRVIAWALAGESRAVFHANVHMVMEGRDSAEFAAVLEAADLVTADGMPLVWALRGLGVAGQERVYGPDLMMMVLAEAERAGISVGLFGGAPETLARLIDVLRRRWPKLAIGFAESPPFRALSPEENADIAARIAASGVRILFVGLGCPKQERWIIAQRGMVSAVMLGVGAAFDFHAGRVRQAPRLLQRAGLEWAFRLAMEPRRLWRRYLQHNPRFAAMLLHQIVCAKRSAAGS